MSDLLAEADEALRREKLENFWRDHGKHVLGALALIVIMTGIVSAYKSWNQSVNIRQTDLLLSAMDQQDPAPALLALSDDLRPGLRGMALLTAAQQFLQAKKDTEALMAFTQAANDKSIPAELRDLAVLATISLRDAAETPETPEQSLARLKKIWSNDRSPWRYHARIEAAILLAETQQDYAGALDHLKFVSEAAEIPESLINKGRALERVYSLKALEATQESEAASQG